MSPPMIYINNISYNSITILVITAYFASYDNHNIIIMLESNLLSVTVTTVLVHEVKVTAIVTSTTYVRCYFNYRCGL